MKKLQLVGILCLALLCTFCGDDGGESFDFQSQKCNSGQQATLTLNINGGGTFTYTEGSSSISHASDTEGLGIDAVSMFMSWVDPSTDDSMRFDVTIENETLAVDTFDFNNDVPINGTVNFYIYKDGALDSWYTFDDWETIIEEYEVYTTTSNGGLTSTRLAFVKASTSGLFVKDGALPTAFNATYTICPRY